MPFEKIELNDGNKVPSIAFGSGSALFGRDATEYVEQALEAGFSHIDTAQMYKNEESVGLALRESGLARNDIFVTTKYISGEIKTAVHDSLLKLGLEQLDLYIIHTPDAVKGRLEAAWKEFEAIKEAGLSKSIGVSNFNLEQLQALVKIAKIKPTVNQIKFHPYNYEENQALLKYCDQHNIVIEAYSSLTPITKSPGGPVDKPIAAAAKRLGITPAQVIFQWARSKGVIIVTTSSKKERLKEYLAVGDLPPLTLEEIVAIDEAGAKGFHFLRASFNHAVARLTSRFVALVVAIIVMQVFVLSYGI